MTETWKKIVSLLMLALILDLVVQCTCSAQPRPGPNDADSKTGKLQVRDEDPGFSISGRVLTGPAGQGAAQVTVTLWHSCDGKTRSAVSDRDGNYCFEGVKPSPCEYVLHVPNETGVWTEPVTISIKHGDIQNMNLYLRLDQSISGVVRDEKTSEPLADFLISPYGSGTQIQTDSQGRYLLYLRPREVVVTCKGTNGYCLLDEDGTEAESVEKNILVGPAEQVDGVDFKARWAPVFWGQVVYPDGRPANGVTFDAWVNGDNRGTVGYVPPGLVVRSAGNLGWGTKFVIKTDENGEFAGGCRVNGRMCRVAREPTLREIVAQVSGAKGMNKLERLSELMKIEGGELTELEGVVWLPERGIGMGFREKPDRSRHKFKPLKIVLGRCGNVTVRVVDPNGKPLPDAWVSTRARHNGYYPSWDSRGEHIADGCYVMHKVIPGVRYHVNVVTPAALTQTEEFVLEPGQERDVNTVTTEWAKEDSLPNLLKQLSSGTGVQGPYERQLAAYLLGRLGAEAKSAAPSLIDQLKIDSIADVRCSIVEALGRIGDASALPSLEAALNDESVGVRQAASKAIEDIQGRQKDTQQNTVPEPNVAKSAQTKEKVPVHPWRRELIDNMSAEDIEQTIRNFANFDDCHLAETSIGGWDSSEACAEFQSRVVVRLMRVRRLFAYGRQHPERVIRPLRDALRGSLLAWPAAFEKRNQDYAKGIHTYAKPDLYDQGRKTCLAATYILAELQDHNALPLLACQYRIHHPWPPPVFRAPVPPAITFYAMHRLAATHPRENLSPEAVKALDEYLVMADCIAPPEEFTATVWNAGYSESDPRFSTAAEKRQSLRGQTAVTLPRYPNQFKDGSDMQTSNGKKSKKMDALFGRLDAFVALAYPDANLPGPPSVKMVE
ncbi:MAG TPA: carboxypeptidase regulatory-like domain-containing protein [Sedimentisphaerales bacterium]|nr:carboxypeptidase regulatory-like domain-containing protein [Sedimentisphaerales bacterium]